MATTKAKKTVSVSQTTVADTERKSFVATLRALQFLRTAKGKGDFEIHKVLSDALTECKTNDNVILLQRVMLHIGDVSRQHNILRENGIISATGGSQERAIFRSVMRWWEKNLPESFETNLNLFTEFTVYENLMFYQITTDRNKGTILREEVLFPMPDKVQNFLVDQIRKGKDIGLIARHLPKYSASKNRTAKKVMKTFAGKASFEYTLPKGKAWVKLNGEPVKGEKITVKAGDVVSFPRNKQAKTLAKQSFVNEWITGLCKKMDWSIEQYNKFRSQQGTPEQVFSSKSIASIAKSDFMNVLDSLTSGQRFRVAKMIAYKADNGNLEPKTKWGNLGAWYIEWEKNQEKVADKLRVAASTGDESAKKELMKEFKVKATGIQTIDLLAELFKGNLNKTQIDNTYQSLIEKMDMVAGVFPIIDGSGSMDNSIVHNGMRLSYRQIVYAMAIAFTTRNPIEEFRNTFGWFSSSFYLCGRTKFADERPNPYLAKKSFVKEVGDHQILSETKTFTENFKAIGLADPKDVSSTNMFASIEYFVKLVKDGKFNTEQLPNALLYLTDNENNSGKTPAEAMQLANSIGWNPLLIFWGITGLNPTMERQMKDVPNCLNIGGFSEGALSQILRGIKTGSVNPQDELWSIFEDKRYSLIK